MGVELIIFGSGSAVVAVAAFGGAVVETAKLTSLRALYGAYAAEPVPNDMIVLVQELGENNDTTGSTSAVS